MTWIDTHLHLYWEDFHGQVSEILDQAEAAGVSKVVCVGTDLSTSREALAMAEADKRVWAAVGIHPTDVHKAPGDWQQQLEQMLGQERVVGIGETGLDYYWDDSTKDLQQAFYRSHLGLARQSGLPIIVHNRNADEDTLAITLAHPNSNGVMHCFPGGPELAQPFLDKGYHISFTGSVTFKNNRAVAETAKVIPLERLLLETDAPFLTPVPHRGKRPNRPAYLPHIGQFIAQLRELSTESLANATTSNAETLFKL